MSKYRETPCKYYLSFGECSKGRKAEHKGYCQHCDKYCPRAKVRHLNKKNSITKSSAVNILPNTERK